MGLLLLLLLLLLLVVVVVAVVVVSIDRVASGCCVQVLWERLGEGSGGWCGRGASTLRRWRHRTEHAWSRCTRRL